MLKQLHQSALKRLIAISEYIKFIILNKVSSFRRLGVPKLCVFFANSFAGLPHIPDGPPSQIFKQAGSKFCTGTVSAPL